MGKRIILFLILTGGLVLMTIANAGNEPNLVAHWELDETSGRIASDSSGNNNNGKLIDGVDWAPTGGKVGGAVSFDGSPSSHIEISVTGMTASAGTVAMWAYLAEPQSRKGRNGYRFLFGYGTNPNRIQLYMNNDDTQLDMGLGNVHPRHLNIMTLSTETWYHIALTWNRSNYAVYVNGAGVATGFYAGLTHLPAAGNIGNNGGEARQGFHGLIDEVIIFDRALSEDEIVMLYSLNSPHTDSEPMLLMLVSAVQEAKAIVKEQNPQEVSTFLEKKIAEYEQWGEQDPNNIGLPYKILSSDLYFLLAKAKEAVGAPTQDVITAYKQSVSRLTPSRPNSASAFSWLFSNIPAEDYIAIVKKYVHNSNVAPINIHHIAKHFESNGNWLAFKLFLDVAFSETGDPVASAKFVERGLSENGVWKKEYLQYCRGKPQLTEYVFEKDCEVAEKYIAKKNFKKAAEAYKDIMKRYGPGRHKSVLELKVCECLFNGGEYQSAISELDRFIARNKTTSLSLAKEAILMKGRCYIQLGDFGKASDELLILAIEYPESKQAPEANFFIGYAYMLQGKFKEAIGAFNVVMQDYPESSYTSKAHTCLIRIENMAN